MSVAEGDGVAGKCGERMHDDRPCGRPVDDHDAYGRCVCHSTTSDRDSSAFRREVEAMLERKDYDFTGFVFLEHASFSGKAFDGPVSFESGQFRRGANFAKCTFGDSVRFVHASFEGRALFDGARFQGAVHFVATGFREDVSFRVATFERSAHFVKASFGWPAEFRRARFRGRAEFASAQFDGGADFTETLFADTAGFRGARFEGDGLFMRTEFRSTVRLVEAAFREAVLFVGAEGNAVFPSESDAQFEYARFGQPERVAFHRVFLGRARLLGADMRRVDFTDVGWARRSGGHCAVWDEMGTRDDGRNHALIGKLYRQLKQNHEDRRDPITAGDFHFGEMHMRRLAHPPKNWFWRMLKRDLSFLALYRWISGYGEEYVRPLVWIVGVILVFAAAFAFIPALALQSSTASGAPELADGWWPRLLHSAMCFLWRGGRPFEPVHLIGHYVSVAEGIIGPPLIAMFVLALNRRFKR